MRRLLKRWWFWLLVVTPVIVIGLVAFWPPPRRGFLTKENIYKAIAACATQGEFEQFFGPPNCASGAALQVDQPAYYVSWEDTVSEKGIFVERKITMAFNRITGQMIVWSLSDGRQPTLWERVRQWIRQHLP